MCVRTKIRIKELIFIFITRDTYLEQLNNARSVEIVLLALKWLFIEQDVVYWNDSGRKKLQQFKRT